MLVELKVRNIIPPILSATRCYWSVMPRSGIVYETMSLYFRTNRSEYSSTMQNQHSRVILCMKFDLGPWNRTGWRPLRMNADGTPLPATETNSDDVQLLSRLSAARRHCEPLDAVATATAVWCKRQRHSALVSAVQIHTVTIVSQLAFFTSALVAIVCTCLLHSHQLIDSFCMLILFGIRSVG